MHLTGPWLESNLEPAAHCACHALLNMAPKCSSHRTTRAGLTVGTSTLHMFPGPTDLSIPNYIWICLAIFAQLMAESLYSTVCTKTQLTDN